MATVLPSPSQQQQQQPQPSLHAKRSSAALHHRARLSTSSFMSTSTSTSSLRSLAASPSKPHTKHVPVRRQLNFGARAGRCSSSSTSSDDEQSPRSIAHQRRGSLGLRRMGSYRLDSGAGLPPSRIPVRSSPQPRPAWGMSPTKRSTSFSFNKSPASVRPSFQPMFVHSPPSPDSPLANAGVLNEDDAHLSPSPRTDGAPMSPDSPSPHNNLLPLLARTLETGSPSSSRSGRRSSDRSPLNASVPLGRRDSRSVSMDNQLHSPFRFLTKARVNNNRSTPPSLLMSQHPQSQPQQPPKPFSLQRIRNSFPSSTSLIGSTAAGKSCASPAGSATSNASSSNRLAFEDARPSPEAFRVSLMKKGQGSMHGLARGNSPVLYQAPPTPNPKLGHLHRSHQSCGDRSPHPSLPGAARSYLSHSLSCRQPKPSSLSHSQQPLAASWSAGSDSSNAATANSPAISPRHKGVDRPAPVPSSLSRGSAPSMAKIQAQSDFLLAVDASMAESPERINGLGLLRGPNNSSASASGSGLGISGFPGFGNSTIDLDAAASGQPLKTSSRSRHRRSGIKRKGSHLDAPSMSNLKTFEPLSSSPPSFGLPRTSGRPPFKRTCGEDVFGSRFLNSVEIGRGMSGGIVYQAVEKATGVVAAIKKSPTYGGQRDRIRLLEEVDILHTLTEHSHPNVVKLLSSWEQQGRLYIHLPLATRGDLSTHLAILADSSAGEPSFSSALYDSGPPGLDEARSWKLLASLASALAHIHALDIIHLDLKPANVLITHEWDVVLADFGTATRWPRRRPSEILQGSGMTSSMYTGEPTSGPVWEEREGDRGYLSAEAVNGVVSKAGDVFSLGLLMLEALTNIIPPSNGDAWTRLRSDDFTDIEAPPPSPAFSSCSTLSPQAEGWAFSTRSSSSYLGVYSPATESDSTLLTPMSGAVSPSAHVLWGSDALTTLVKQLMASDAARRPSPAEILAHPVVARAQALMSSGEAGPAIAPEPSAFLAALLDARKGSEPALLRPGSFAPSFFPPASVTSAKDTTLDLARDLERMDVDLSA